MKTLKILMVALCLSLIVPASFAQQKTKKAKAGKVAKAGGDAAAGKDLFEGKCSVCHNADSAEKKIGPGLKGVKDGKLPSGKPATHDGMLEQLNTGGGAMPPYKDILTDEEKENVIAYVMTL
jgi:cytochrome c